jgi:hypothetical protein
MRNLQEAGAQSESTASVKRLDAEGKPAFDASDADGYTVALAGRYLFSEDRCVSRQ